ncbi:MAG: ribbon-helix-helix protein, CopG family [Candidatus Lokiarchaeota archaeon]|nr:ribbon-helix-helix protein, CopG family [Candidatus Lokiarchaeota archaeon]MBD3337705.1 ribbon-helix-helix protein, CopG family [Candidatus Lokiarchaeota archaeon]
MKEKKTTKKKSPMKNITINLPDIYVDKIQWLIEHKLIANRSEAVRNAIREWLEEEFSVNLELLDFFEVEKKN